MSNSNMLVFSKTPKDFKETFIADNNRSIEEYITLLTGIMADNIFLVGSIPQGSATVVSDIDIIITGTSPSSYPNYEDCLTQVSRTGGLVNSVFFSRDLDYELDITFLSANALNNLVHGLDTGDVYLNDMEIKILSILRNAWVLGGSTEIIESLQSDTLSIFCATRYYTLALQEMEDALNAYGNNAFVLSMLRSVVYRIGSSLLAMSQLCFSGPKWIKKMQAMIDRGHFGSEGQALAKDIIQYFTDDSSLSISDLDASINKLLGIFDVFQHVADVEYLSHSIAIRINKSIQKLEHSIKELSCAIPK